MGYVWVQPMVVISGELSRFASVYAERGVSDGFHSLSGVSIKILTFNHFLSHCLIKLHAMRAINFCIANFCIVRSKIQS